MATTTPADLDDVARPSSSAAYVAAVAAALAGVEGPERQELLDDLAEHLAELEAEDGDSLAARLGPPEEYATDLVASAGLDLAAGEHPPAAPLWRRTIDATTASLQGQRAADLRAFAVEARPAWWLVRGWCVLALLTVATSDNRSTFPLPHAFHDDLVSFVALVGATLLSVRLGRSGGWLARLATVAGVIGLVVAIGDAGSTGQYIYQGPSNDNFGYLTGPDGMVISNIWPYDGEGNPLDGVLLFDQDGRPVTVAPDGITPGQLPIPGLFPQPQTHYEYDDATGEERQVPATAPVVSVPRLNGSTTTTPPPDPAATTTTTLGAG